MKLLDFINSPLFLKVAEKALSLATEYIENRYIYNNQTTQVKDETNKFDHELSGTEQSVLENNQ
jgi:hypothetical protein